MASGGRPQQGTQTAGRLASVHPPCTAAEGPNASLDFEIQHSGCVPEVVQVLLRQSKVVHLEPEPGKDIPTGGGERSIAVWPLPLLVRKGSGPEACSQAPHRRASFPIDAWPQNTHSSDTSHTHTHSLHGLSFQLERSPPLL